MKKNLLILVIISLLLGVYPSMSVSAQNGLPTSANFGYGVRLDLRGIQINPSINAVGSLKLDWIGVDFNWKYLWPTEDAIPNLDTLNQAIYLAQQNHLNVMVSITEPPAWAVDENGPDPIVTTKIAEYLARTYPDVVLAIELFPGANTTRGWGTKPNPPAYFKLLKTVTKALRSNNSNVTIIAAGLIPLPQNPPQGDIDDLVFLESLYKAGSNSWMPILGLRLTDITGDPMNIGTQTEKRVIRHYEEIRQLMLKHDHRNGLIWITGFSWPSGNIQGSDSIYRNTGEQTRWLTQAYQIMKAQLYIGVAFFSQVNPHEANSNQSNAAVLIQSDLNIHPALTNLGLMITPPDDNTPLAVQIVLTKRIVQEISFKPSTGISSTKK